MNEKLTFDEWAEKAMSDGWRPPLHGAITKEQVSDFIGEEAYLIEDYGKKYWITKSGKVLSSAKGKIRQLKVQSGSNIVYPFVSIGDGYSIWMHRTLGSMFIDNPDNHTVINHIDGNKHNYSLDNLEWCTPSENSLHAYRLKLRSPMLGSTNGNSRFTEKEVKAIKKRLISGERVKDISISYGVTHSVISAIKNGRSWSHVL